MHVEGADFAGEDECVGDELAGDGWRELVRPPVDVQAGVETAGLFVVDHALAVGVWVLRVRPSGVKKRVAS